MIGNFTFDENVNNYNKLFNIPSINGITIFHPKLNNLGISEIPADKIVELFDKVWKFEAMTNPVFAMTHKPIISETDEIGLVKFAGYLALPDTSLGSLSKGDIIYLSNGVLTKDKTNYMIGYATSSKDIRLK